MSPSDTRSGTPVAPEVISYRQSFREHFARLNRQWIEQHFRVEEADQLAFAPGPRGQPGRRHARADIERVLTLPSAPEPAKRR